MIAYGSFARFYDSLMQGVDYSAACKFICKKFNENDIKNGSLVLDVGCGTGALVQMLSNKGYDVTGVDVSSEMLSVAITREYKKQPLFLCQNIDSLDLYGTVKGVVSTLDCFNHLDSIKQLDKGIENISLFTESGGVFIFDINTVFKHKEILKDNSFVYEQEDVYCVWQNNYDCKGKKVNISLDFFEINDNGSYDRYCEEFCEIDIEISDMKKILDKHDFDVLEINDGYRDVQINDCSQRAVFVCEKR